MDIVITIGDLVLILGIAAVGSLCLFISTQVRMQHLATNSRLDQLLDVTKRLATKEGYDAGRASRDAIEEAGLRIGAPDDPRSG